MQLNLLEEGRAIDGMSLSFNIPCLVESTVHGMVWWDQEVFAGIQSLFLFEGIRMDDRVMALLWSGAGEGAKGRGFSFGFCSVDHMTIVFACSNRIGPGAIT